MRSAVSMEVSVSSASLVYGIAKLVPPLECIRLAIGLVNITSILGGAAMPPIVGWFIDRPAVAGGLQGGGGVLEGNDPVPASIPHKPGTDMDGGGKPSGQHVPSRYSA